MEKKTTVSERILTFVCFGILFAVCLSSVFVSKGENTVSENVIRLHIFANSDSDEDTAVKNLVKDRVSDAMSKLLSDCKNTDEAKKIIYASTQTISREAKNVLCENNKNTDVYVNVGMTCYPVRRYENLTFPAGQYLSVRVSLGKGQGHNLWCVLYPKLCDLGNEDDERAVLTQNGVSQRDADYLLYADEKSEYDGKKDVKIKFALFEALKNKFSK